MKRFVFGLCSPAGKPLGGRSEIMITAEGLALIVDDDYYSGTLTPADALELGRALVEAFSKKETGP